MRGRLRSQVEAFLLKVAQYASFRTGVGIAGAVEGILIEVGEFESTNV
jgi:hypothetical protein